jgi:hypothetical protein
MPPTPPRSGQTPVRPAIAQPLSSARKKNKAAAALRSLGTAVNLIAAAAPADPGKVIRDIRGCRFVWPGWLTAALTTVSAMNLAATAAAADSEDIRDIRGPRFVWPGWLTAALIAGGVLLAVLGYWGWRWLRRRRRPRALAPFELALQRLEDIRPLMQPHTVREFSTAASDIVRSYIELRFDVTATQLTTEEFLRDLLTSTRAALLRHRALLAEFLQQCDLVKFAGISLTLQNMESLHHSARAFVLETSKPDTDIGQSAAGTAPPHGPPPASPREAHDSLPST